MMRAAMTSVFGLAAFLPLAASADTMPSYASRQPESITGTIASVTGKYTLTINDTRGFVDSVTLRDGTIIQPTGIPLEPGQSVSISGKANGNTFDAMEIDVDTSSAPTTDTGQPPAYYNDGAYPYAADAYPYYAPAYGAYSPYGYGIYGYSPYYYGFGGFGGYYGGYGYYGYCCSSGGPSKYTGPGQRYGPAPPHNYAPPATGGTGTSSGRGLQPISRAPVFGRPASAPSYHGSAPSARASAPTASRGGGGGRR